MNSSGPSILYIKFYFHIDSYIYLRCGNTDIFLPYYLCFWSTFLSSIGETCCKTFSQPFICLHYRIESVVGDNNLTSSQPSQWRKVPVNGRQLDQMLAEASDIKERSVQWEGFI